MMSSGDLAVGAQFVAMALTTFPASLYMGRVGRKIGFITGAIIGASGGTLGTYAIISSDFTLFCVASLLTGSFNGFCVTRFAAADVATAGFRSKAISYVLAGSIVAALLGPTLARNTADLLPAQFAGVYMALIVFTSPSPRSSASSIFPVRRRNSISRGVGLCLRLLASPSLSSRLRGDVRLSSYVFFNDGYADRDGGLRVYSRIHPT